MENTPQTTKPDTIVLIHGLWMTPRSWEHWVKYYTDKGFKVLTPAYPGFEVEVEALRADPSIIAKLTVPETVAHLEKIIGELDKPPILIGHSFGGIMVQILLDHGFGAAGVVIDSAQVEGIFVSPPSQIKALFPILKNPTNYHHAVGFNEEQFHYAFTNTVSAEESAKIYERYYIDAPGSFVWLGVLANILPGHQPTWVDFHNDNRAPLFFIAGGEDNIMPPSVNRSNAMHYKSKAITAYKEIPGRSHNTCGQEGWEEVADIALEWALNPVAEGLH